MRNMRMAAAIGFGWWASLALVSGGCGGKQLVPAAAANRAVEQPSAAVADVGGVRLLVEGDAWPGRSATLARGVTAVLVIVENRGDRPLVVHHNDFVLEGEGGERFTTLSPNEVPIGGPHDAIPAFETVFSPADAPQSGDAIRPPPAPNPVNSVSVRETSFPENPLYYRSGTSTPTSFRRDVEARALTDGTLAPGQKRAGFVYFAGGLGGERRLTFQARLERTGGSSAGRHTDVALANIPLRVQ
jgi:hypothetical protein